MTGITALKYAIYLDAKLDITMAESARCSRDKEYLKRTFWIHVNKPNFDIINIRHEIHQTLLDLASSHKVTFDISNIFEEMDMILEEAYKHLFVPCLRLFSPILFARFESSLLVEKPSRLTLSQLIGKYAQFLSVVKKYEAENDHLEKRLRQFLVKRCIPLLNEINQALLYEAKCDTKEDL